MKVSSWSFKIEDKAANDAFKTYLRQKVRDRIKFLVAISAVFLLGNAFYGSIAMMWTNTATLFILLSAWWVTARHLWTIDYFFLLFTLVL